jgi:hypothetical protein
VIASTVSNVSLEHRNDGSIERTIGDLTSDVGAAARVERARKHRRMVAQVLLVRLPFKLLFVSFRFVSFDEAFETVDNAIRKFAKWNSVGHW